MALDLSQPLPLYVFPLISSFLSPSLPEPTPDAPASFPSPQPACRVPARGARQLGYLSPPRASSAPGGLTLLARAGQLEFAGRGHETGPVLDGAREAGPVDPANARRDGRQLPLAASVAEPLASRGDVLPGRGE